MEDIDYYIRRAAEMEDTSDGGSSSFRFGDVVLVKYEIPSKYGMARSCEESVAIQANERNSRGVRTPAHLAIKRTTEGERNFCWVLQEMARGKNFSEYCREDRILESEAIISQIPDSHYEKFVSDLSELLFLGIEMKPKNFFYDEDEKDGGFTVIDLLDGTDRRFNPESFRDISFLWINLSAMPQALANAAYYAGLEDKTKSDEMVMRIRQRLFMAMEKTIPGFDKHRRWLLRTLPPETLKYFEEHGTEVGDLTLDDEEMKHFNKTLRQIVVESIGDVESGKSEYWQIAANYVRISLAETGMKSAWLYHRANTRKLEDYDDRYDYETECERELESTVLSVFDEQIEELSTRTDNPNIIRAKQVIDSKRMKKFVRSADIPDFFDGQKAQEEPGE
jgi:hypothetical protein